MTIGLIFHRVFDVYVDIVMLVRTEVCIELCWVLILSGTRNVYKKLEHGLVRASKWGPNLFHGKCFLLECKADLVTNVIVMNEYYEVFYFDILN